jgi:hypothetical protein
MLPSKNYSQSSAARRYMRQESKSDLFLLELFISPPFAECLSNRRISSRIPIVGAIELGTPNFDDVHETLQQDLLNTSVELGYPMLKVGISL